MSLSWFWLAAIVVFTGLCVQQLRALFAMPEDGTVAASRISSLKEEHRAAEQESP
jgi:hypothetical protein